MMPRFTIFAQIPLTCLIALSLLGATAQQYAESKSEDPPFDLLIRNGRIVDGSGAPWYRADVGIRDGRIDAIGGLSNARAVQTIDARDQIVAPGFIDMMGQTATPMLEDPKSALNLLTQGITTINAGEGGSAAPLSAEDEERFGWRTMGEYFHLLDMKGLPVNVVQTVGHTQVRRLVVGEADRAPTDEEMTRMEDLVREAMEAGAIGVSTALIYPPAVYATTDEIAALAKVAGEFGGRYYTHMRNEGDRLLEAIDEAFEIGRKADCPVHIFHLKAAGERNWGKMQEAIARIRSARMSGRQITADVYPYINNGLGISAMIHPRHFAAGREAFRQRLGDPDVRAVIREEMEQGEGWENWFRHVGHNWERVMIGQTSDERYGSQVGQSLAAMARARDEDPWETFFNLVEAGAFALPQSMTEANKILAMKQPFVSFCTDVGPAGSRIASHPRGYGSFPRLLSRYVRDLGALSLEQAVAQASAAAANNVMAYDRGRIAEGLAADIIVFDESTVQDQATFAAPDRHSDGIEYVIVNGVLALEQGETTGKRPGRVLRGPGYREGLAPHAVSAGRSPEGFEEIGGIVRSVMETHKIPGAAVAVTRGGRLVYAKGFGYADIASREKATPTHLFRIASISKPITAVAILKLVEQGELDLDAPVYEILGYSKPENGEDSYDARQERITIRHLLQHRGGWDRNVSFDAMFQAVRFAQATDSLPPAGPLQVIEAMREIPLDFEPGERYAYSNYGYCLLGRVIEEVTGQAYDAYVKEHVLAPMGIRSTRLGNTRLSNRQPGEVRYYHPGFGTSVFAEDLEDRVPHPYGAWNVEAMDSHGGWLSSAIDLARFACAFDDPEASPVLTSESIDLMAERPPGLAGHEEDGTPKDQYYGLGWSVRTDPEGGLTLSHSGSLPGTNTLLIRQPGQQNIVILVNARTSPTASRVANILLNAIQPAIDRWVVRPDIELFEDYE